MINFGFIDSELDGTEQIIRSSDFSDNLNLPIEYSYKEYLTNVFDQGSDPICVPCSVAAFLYWKNSINNINEKISLNKIFEQRLDKKLNGMQIKTALSFLKHSNDNLYKIYSYAILVSPLIMQKSLITNGPFIIALDVKDYNKPDFWNGDNIEGRHAVAITGYNEIGFEIRNSWGYSYGNNGYYILPYYEFGKIREAWALI